MPLHINYFLDGTQIQKVLENLVEQKYLEKDKVAGTNYYKTNRDMVDLG
ncbi:MAG: hypothetical protein K1W34_18220 [Lachnospiraceae bacterium]